MSEIKKSSCEDSPLSRRYKRRKVENNEDSKISKKESGNSRQDLFAPRSVIGPRDILVNVPLGKVALSHDQQIQGVVKNEAPVKMEPECMDFDNSDQVTGGGSQEDSDHVNGEDMKMEIYRLEFGNDGCSTSITPCSCACWQEMQSLKQVINQQAEQIKDLKSVAAQLLGKQLKSNADSKRSTNEKQNGGNKRAQDAPNNMDKEEKEDAVGGKSSLSKGHINHVKDMNSKGPSRHLSSSTIARVSSLDTSQPMEGSSGSSVHPHHPRRLSVLMNTEQFSQAGSLVTNSCPLVSIKIENGKESGFGAIEQQQDSQLCSFRGYSNGVTTKRNNRQRSAMAMATPSADGKKCNQCKKFFKTRYNLYYHKLTEHRGMQYQCSDSTSDFTNKNNIGIFRHEKLHTKSQQLPNRSKYLMEHSSSMPLSMQISRKHQRPLSKTKIPNKQTKPLNKNPLTCVSKGSSITYNWDSSFSYHLSQEFGL